MKKAQCAAFKLYDQVFQSLVPKGLNDKFLKVEESKSKEG
nr:Bm1199 [Brugia malayi]